MLMALYDHLTHREGVGSMPDNTCTKSKGLKETKMYLTSWLTHRAQKSSAPTSPVYFLLQRSGWRRSAEMVHPDEYLLTQNVTLTDMWTGRHRGLTLLPPRLWHGWHLPAWVLTSSCSQGCWCLPDRGQCRHCAPCFPCCHPGLCQAVVSRCSHSPNTHVLSPCRP